MQDRAGVRGQDISESSRGWHPSVGSAPALTLNQMIRSVRDMSSPPRAEEDLAYLEGPSKFLWARDDPGCLGRPSLGSQITWPEKIRDERDLESMQCHGHPACF